MRGCKIFAAVILWCLLVLFWFYNTNKIYTLKAVTNEFDYKLTGLASAFQKEQPKVPFLYWQRHENDTLQLDASCAPFPDLILDLDYHNDYWQTYRPSRDAIYQLYGAYYDRRVDFRTRQRPVVRLLAMVKGLNNQSNGRPEENAKNAPTSYCQLWYDDEKDCCRPRIVPVLQQPEIHLFATSKDQYAPYMISCDAVDDIEAPPVAVSLVPRPCAKASNSLRVWSTEPTQKPQRHSYAICVKGLHFPYVDYAARLVEWLELQRILGAERVYVYVLNIQPQLREILAYYVAEGFVELTEHSLVFGLTGLRLWQDFALKYRYVEKWLEEALLYNDCFYRHGAHHSYISMLDVDEVLMPLPPHNNWQQLIDDKMVLGSNNEECIAAICFQHVFFPSHIEGSSWGGQAEPPKYMHMLHHTTRYVQNTVPWWSAMKCLHNTAAVFAVHNHGPIYGNCAVKNLDPQHAQMQHYRILEPDVKAANLTMMEDANILRFRDELILRTRRVLHALKLLG